jgi:hypothetical protein
MSSAGPSAPGNQGERYAWIQAYRARFSVTVSQPEASTAFRPRQRRFAVAAAGEKRDPGSETAEHPANVGSFVLRALD